MSSGVAASFTAQEVFNISVRGLAAQGWMQSVGSAVTNAGSCVYASSSLGRRCAVGHLLTDEEAAFADRRGIAVDSVMSLLPEVRARLGEHARLLRHLQRAHDSAITNVEMRGSFERAAHFFGLEWPEGVSHA